MKKITGLFVLLMMFNSFLYAVPANPEPIIFTQPNGDTLTVIIKGDERINWYETMDGYTLLVNRDGYLTYAYLDENRDLQPSGFIATTIEDRNIVVLSFLNTIEKNLFFSDTQRQFMLKVWQIEDEAYRAFENENSEEQTTRAAVKVLCAFVEFPEKPMIKTINDFENLLNTLGYTGTSVYGSVRDFYKEASYDKIDMQFTLCGIYTAPESESYYAGSSGTSKVRELARDIAQQVAETPGIDFRDYYINASNSVAFHFIFAGYGKENFGSGAGPGLIWSHQSYISPVYNNGKSISTYSCTPELRGSSGTNITTVGVIAHELGHALFNLPDFYDTGSGNYTGTGNWDIMASGSWNGSPSGSRPAHFNMYIKIKKGWATPMILSSPIAITDMPNAAENPVAYRINTTTINEYFLLENRQKLKFDTNIPGNGLIIYRVHANIASSENSNTVNASHPQRMYPVYAGATVAIPNSTPSSYGSINSSRCPFPGSNNITSFTDDTTPSMKSWAGVNTNKPITHIKNISGLVSFDFMGGDCQPARNVSVTYSGDCRKATINWSAPLTGSGFQYNVYRDEIKIADAISATSFEDEAFDSNNGQKWSVAVVCDSEESMWTSLIKPACGVAINENEFTGMNVYSHQNNIFIKNVDAEKYKPTVEIHDMIGRLVYKNTITDIETTIALLVADGIYCVKIISQDTKIAMKKVLISKK